MHRGKIERAPPAIRGLALASLMSVLALAGTPTSAAELATATVAAIADFDNIDTAGESGERTAAHAARVQAFSGMIRDSLAADRKFQMVEFRCPTTPCSPRTMPAAAFVAAARESGVRLVVYGAIQKMSTLVQIGVVQAVDLKTDSLVLNQHITFRGDDDQAFRRAAIFVADYLKKSSFAP